MQPNQNPDRRGKIKQKEWRVIWGQGQRTASQTLRPQTVVGQLQQPKDSCYQCSFSYQSKTLEFLFGKHIKWSPAKHALVSVFTVFCLQSNVVHDNSAQWMRKYQHVCSRVVALSSCAVWPYSERFWCPSSEYLPLLWLLLQLYYILEENITRFTPPHV